MPAWLYSLLSCLGIVASIGLGVAVFATALSPRQNLAGRMAVVVGVVVVATALLSLWWTSTGWQGTQIAASPYTGVDVPLQLLIFSALLVASVFVVRFLCDASLWTALFCCSAGYALQNLASGASELVWVLVMGTGPIWSLRQPGAYGLYSILTWSISGLVYVVAYLGVTRRLDRQGLESVSDHAMLMMMAVVILMVIGFDLVIKSLSAVGTALPYIVALRLVHGFICVFTVWMEYELLVNRRLQTQRDVAKHVLAERERQYQQSRQSMDAINARMHDLRHQVFRTLSDSGASLDRRTARTLAQEVAVYDSVVHTGNEALDTALTQKRLVCQSHGITLSCVADGEALAFMDDADVYALLSAALDDAILAVQRAGKKDMQAGGRSIAVVVRRALGVTSVHIEQYGHVQNPDPTIKSLVQRYGGTLSTKESNDRSQLDLMFQEP